MSDHKVLPDTRVDVSVLSDEALAAHHAGLVDEAAKVRVQLETAREDLKLTGREAPREWVQRASKARELLLVAAERARMEIERRRAKVGRCPLCGQSV